MDPGERLSAVEIVEHPWFEEHLQTEALAKGVMRMDEEMEEWDSGRCSRREGEIRGEKRPSEKWRHSAGKIRSEG